MDSTAEVEQFYDALSSDYDEMTRFHPRLEKEEAVLRRWVERFKFRKVLDAACGTGLHAIVFARLGMAVTAADLSAKMLEKARENARQAKSPVRWVQASLQNLTHHIQEQFQAIFCLGNSLPHLLTKEDLEQTFKNFYQLLQPGGILVVQLLNYHKILLEKQRIIGIRRQGDLEFVRFYDFLEKVVRFNILTIRWKNNTPEYTLQSTTLYPYRKENLEAVLHLVGLGELQFYGDMQFTPFNSNESANLVVVAKKT